MTNEPPGPLRELGRAVERFRALDLLDLVPRFTLILLLVYRIDSRELQYFLIILSVAGLVLPGLHRSSYLWLGMAFVLGYRVWLVGHILDNHGYLLVYWCLALGLSLGLANPQRSLATQARLLIGFCFLFAALWKGVLSSDYLTGDFFHLTFLNDARFSTFAAAVSGGLTEGVLSENRAAVSGLLDPLKTVDSVELQTTGQLFVIARFATWWTLLLESLLAIQFLVPTRWLVAKYRDATLMLFALTTYAIAPVMAFGWLLMAMGIAQTEPDQSRTRLLYVLTTLVIVGYKYTPWLRDLFAFLAS